MKLNSNQKNINTNFSANLLKKYLLEHSAQTPRSSSVSLPNLYLPSNVSVNKTEKYTTINPSKIVTNFYTPKQLLYAYSNPIFVSNLISANPNINKLLSSHSIEPKIYPSNIKNIVNTHLTTTTANALSIANKMGLSAVDKKDLELACVFHDFGKILIPPEIINKPEALSKQEKQIIDLHAQLGFELLSSTGMNERVLNLIKNHHLPQGENADILSQILSVADIYSALREERSYKQQLKEQDALNLLDQKALKGEVSTEVVNALKALVVSHSVA